MCESMILSAVLLAIHRSVSVPAPPVLHVVEGWTSEHRSGDAGIAEAGRLVAELVFREGVKASGAPPLVLVRRLPWRQYFTSLISLT